jgi:hypothetical protein
MKTAAIIISVLIIGEMISNALFYFVRKLFAKEDTKDEQTNPDYIDPKVSIGKGIFERIVLFVFLTFGHMPILILFGALKIGTRLKDSNNKSISNDYFLVGNLLSVLMAFIYYLVIKYCFEIDFIQN